MGCCMCFTQELRGSVFDKQENEMAFKDSCNSFNDISLSSNSSESDLIDWLEFKKFKSSTESTALFSSFNHTKMCRKYNKNLSNTGSIVDSFVVTFPLPLVPNISSVK